MMLRSLKLFLISAAIILCCCITPSPAQASSLSGLATLRALAREAVPYATAMADDKPTVIEFYADWCTTCQGLAKTVQTLERDYRDRVNFVMLNIDDPQWAPQVEANRVTGVPQLTFLNRDHQVQRHIVGAVPRRILSNVIEQYY